MKYRLARISAIAALALLASTLATPAAAQGLPAEEKPATPEQSVVLDTEKIEEDSSTLTPQMQTGYLSEKITAESTCVQGEEGEEELCIDQGPPPEETNDGLVRPPELDPYKPLPLPNNLCRSGYNIVDRTAGCSNAVITLTHRTTKGKVLGTAVVDSYVYQYGSSTSSVMANQLTLRTARTTGTGNKFQIVGNLPKCSGSCAKTGTTTSLSGKMLSTGQTLNAESYYKWTGTTTRTSQLMNWGITFKHASLKIVHPLTLNSAGTFRCDKEIGASAGCVVPKATPTIAYSRASYPNFGRHVSLAQQSGLPGARTPLTKLNSGQSESKNRAKACPSRLARPAGTSCDEYPFASTQQGGYYGGGTGRTFTQCGISDAAYPLGVRGATGYSACMIPAKENSSAGGKLSASYQVGRILSGDKFYVWIQ